MSVRLVYEDIAVGADEDAVMSATGADEISTIALLPFGSGNAEKYATLEPNSWFLDGSRVLYRGGTVAFWSDDFSGEDCRFETPPTVTATFDENYSSMGITLMFGEFNYCSEVRIVWYHDDTVLEDKTFYPPGATYYCEAAVEAYNKIVIRFVETNLPKWRARLDAVIFGTTRIYERDELRGVTVIEEVDLISRELAENVLDWQLSSRETIEYMFQRRQPVSAYDGDTLIGMFYITDSNRKSLRLFDVSCVDAIGVLSEDDFPDAVYTNKNALELAEEICAGFTVLMEESLQSKTVSGIVKGKTRRQALQQLCFALGAVADTGGSLGIKIFVPPSTDPKEVGADRIRTGATLKETAIVTAVKLTSHSYGTTAVSGASTVDVNGVTYYDTQTVTTIENPNVTATEKANVISISDATLVSPANVAEVAQNVYNHYLRRGTHHLKFRLDGEAPADLLSTVTPWGTTMTGNLTRASIVLSGIALAEAEVLG